MLRVGSATLRWLGASLGETPGNFAPTTTTTTIQGGGELCGLPDLKIIRKLYGIIRYYTELYGNYVVDFRGLRKI